MLCLRETGKVLQSGPLSCLQSPNQRRVPLKAAGTGVGGVDLYPGAGLLQKVTAEKMPARIENEMRLLHVL